MRTTRMKIFFCLFVAASCAVMCVAQEFRPTATDISQHISAFGRKSVAVTDFTDLDGNPTRLGRYLAEEFSDALFGEAKSFAVVDRTHLKAILQEHKLATSGLIDPSTARMLGQIAGVDTLVTGTITPFEEHVHVSLKVLDTETARILAADTIEVPRTKTISDLIRPEAEIRPSNASLPSSAGHDMQQQTASVALPAPILSNQFLFTSRGCQNKAGKIICTFTVTNKGGSDRTLMLDGNDSRSFMVDEQGNQYNQPTIVFGGRPNGSYISLIPNVPVNLTIAPANVPDSVTALTVSVAGYISSEGNIKAVIREIPVSRP
jgi:TolB-like protein